MSLSRRKALIGFGIDPTDWPSVLRDEPVDAQPEVVDIAPLPLSDEAWCLIANAFPKPHANQILSWRETVDALIKLTQTGMAWVRLGDHAEAIRARLHRSRVALWNDIEQRASDAPVDAAERERIVTVCTFARRYLAERDARVNAAPTPTAARRLRGD